MTTLDLSATSRSAFGFPHSHIIICISHPSSHSGLTRASSEWSIAESPRRKERSGWQRQVLRSGALASPLVSVGVDSRFQLATRSDE
jgi:hypothetical protein